MPVLDIAAARITDWKSFHDVFAESLGFPDDYGRNLDAWIDCMTYLDAGDGATDTVVPRGEILTLRVIGGRAFRNHAPEQYDGLIESAAFVNWRRLEAGDDAIIALAFS